MWIDYDLLRFISNEFRAMTQAELLPLQTMVRELVSYTMNLSRYSNLIFKRGNSYHELHRKYPFFIPHRSRFHSLKE